MSEHITLVLLVFTICTAQASNYKYDSIIKKLFTTISGYQEHSDASYSLFPFSWEKMRGMYKSDVKLNFHGDEEYSLVREMFNVPDNNMFTPAWIISCLIEAYEYGKAPKPDSTQIRMALEVIDKFRDKNKPYVNSEMTFWPQKLNSTTEYYESSPANLFGVLSLPDYLPVILLEDILKAIGLNDLEGVFEKLLRDKNMFAEAFRIPPDFDDTFVNIGLGGLLQRYRKDFSDGSYTWDKQNTNLSSVFASVKKYAYRPFSNNPAVNTIDPRTYFYARDFLDNAKSRGGDVAVIPTWIQDAEEVKTLFDKGVVMPFNVNNVDVTVSANFLYGVTTCVMNGVCQADIDDGVQQIFLNTTSLVTHEIYHNLSSRPDLALTYYPSKFEFYWFVSRSYALMNRFIFKEQQSIPPILFNMLQLAYDELRPVLRGQMTNDIVQSAHVDTQTGLAYIDNFLGDGDLDRNNKTIVRAEDRVFTTSVSVNALINTWTLWNNGSLVWEKDTPTTVKQLLSKSTEWLGKNALSGRFKPWNTFFSGSGKSLESMPFFFPANRREYFNGTTFSDDKFPSSPKNILGMKGVVTADEYNALLKKPHFGRFTEMTFNGYNSEAGGFFPFWSSDPYTYATTLVSLAQYANIEM